MKTKTSPKKISLTLPDSWNALSDIQLDKICLLLHSGADGSYFDVLAFKMLLDPQSFKERSRMHTVLTQVPISELKKHFSFVYGNNNRTIFPKQITVNETIYHPPFDKISNLTAHEFAVADDLHIKFRETQNVDFLYYLAATLYVSSHQPRPYFDKNNLEALHHNFRQVPLARLLAVELAYAGCKEYLAQRYKKAFPISKSGNSKKKYGFGKVILEMSGKKFGNHEETKSTNVYTFLAEFEENLNPPKKK